MERKYWPKEKTENFNKGAAFHKHIPDLNQFTHIVFCLGCYYWEGDEPNDVPPLPGTEHNKDREKAIFDAFRRSGHRNLSIEQKAIVWEYVAKRSRAEPIAQQRSNVDRHKAAIRAATKCYFAFEKIHNKKPGVRELSRFAGCHTNTASQVIKSQQRTPETPQSRSVGTQKPTPETVKQPSVLDLQDRSMSSNLFRSSRTENRTYNIRQTGIPLRGTPVRGRSVSGVIEKPTAVTTGADAGVSGVPCRYCQVIIVWQNRLPFLVGTKTRHFCKGRNPSS